MRKTAAAMTNLIADLRERSGLDWRRLAILGGKIQQRTIAAKPPNQFQIADHAQMQASRRREWKIGKHSEDTSARIAPGCRRIATAGAF